MAITQKGWYMRLNDNMLVSLRIVFEVNEMDNPTPHKIIEGLKARKETYEKRSKRLDNAEEARSKNLSKCISKTIEEIQYLVENDLWDDFVECVYEENYEIPINRHNYQSVVEKSR